MLSADSVHSVITGSIQVSAYLHSELTEKIIGLAIKVHKNLGSAYAEKVYQRALYLELKKSGLRFEREKEMSVTYDRVRIGKQVLDFVVEGKVIVEIKKADEIAEVHVAQLASYLKSLKLGVGLILNFGPSTLQIKRVVN